MNTENLQSFNFTDEEACIGNKACYINQDNMVTKNFKLSLDYTKKNKSDKDKIIDNKVNNHHQSNVDRNNINYESKGMLNVAKIDYINNRLKLVPSKTESNSKSKESVTRSGLRSTSQSKSQSKSNSKYYHMTGKNKDIRNRINNKLSTLVNDIKIIKQIPSTSLLNDYSRKVKNMTKKNVKLKNKTSNSSSNLEALQFNKISCISPHNKRNISKKNLTNTLTDHVETLEYKKNLPRKIMDLTYNTTEKPVKYFNENILEIKGEHKDREENDYIIQEVKSNLDENYKNLFNFSYDNFLKDQSESARSIRIETENKNEN